MIRIFDQYEYDPGNVIGRGGMGTVYRGVNCNDHTPVAIKYLDPTVIKSNPDLVARFQREGQALRDLNHPNIVKIIAAGQCGDDHY
jgi:serine/threonine protein kinase